MRWTRLSRLCEFFSQRFGVGLVGLSYADGSDRIALICFIIFQVGVSGYRREADVE